MCLKNIQKNFGFLTQFNDHGETHFVISNYSFAKSEEHMSSTLHDMIFEKNNIFVKNSSWQNMTILGMFSFNSVPGRHKTGM